ncbi:hypothetical protein [Rhodopirellula europaea]|uniref:hypothetical protein n=1 Tax=Rhodopirellula europaea TaxID=1263866 RepID=UPI003D2A3A79
MKSSKASFTADGVKTLNSVCDEFRRQLKVGLLECDGNSPVTPTDVLRAAEALQQSPWLTKFQKDDSDDSERRAA